MKKWKKTDDWEVAFNNYNDNVDEIEQGFDNRYTKQEVDDELSEKVQNFKLENLIENGDFSDGTNGWDAFTNSSINAINGGLEWSKTVVPSIIKTDYYIDIVATQKYYIKTGIKGTSEQAIINAYFRTSTTISSDFTANTVVQTSEMNHSGILTATATVKAGLFLRDSQTTNTVIIDDVICINLTQVFGAGNEPTKEEMDELIKVVPNGWWDGELTLEQKEVVQWLLKLESEKANKQQEAWITPTLLNGWENFSPSYSQCAYFKDQFGIVHLKGFVSSGEIGQYIFFLPNGYRPQLLTYFPISSNNTSGVVTIGAWGNVTCIVGNNTWVTLDGLTFKGV